MGARLQLTLLAGVSGVLLLLLGYAALSAMKGLMEVPPQSWGMSELSDAVVAGTCAVGALGALWHLVSAVVALIAIPGPHDRTSFRPDGAPGPAARFLNGWGAPAARRIAASALVVCGSGSGGRFGYISRRARARLRGFLSRAYKRVSAPLARARRRPFGAPNRPKFRLSSQLRTRLRAHRFWRPWLEALLKF